MVEQVNIEKVLTELKRVAATAVNEEEFKINAERILYNEVISKLGLQPGRYEYTFISGGRLDALYGHVLIEYKAPGKLSKPSDIARAKEQLIGYIGKEAEVEERYRLFLGVILSDRIAFVKYDSKAEDWLMRGPYDLNRETVLRLIEAMRGLRRKKLAVEELLRDFGPGSPITRRAVNVFYERVTESKSSKVEALFNDWKRLFLQVCAYSPEKLKGLEAEYGISSPVDYNALLFSIHTYCALIMKLLGAEVAYLYGAGKWLKSYVTELEDAHMKGSDALKRALEDLESGGIFRKLLNITNFIEGDYFSWYLEELDEELAHVIAETAKRLADYEPATPVLEPEYTRDLLKRLYQNMVPKRIRHDLGEYYTPDWLAELVLNEVGLTSEGFEKLAQERDDTLAPLNLRVLDPACGSGTFLALVMKVFREYAEEHYLRDVLANYLLRNIVGFDLNPIAVLAARTNYLLAVADLFQYVKGSIEIPIYLADSLLVETRTTLTGTTYVIRTYVGEFQLPKSIVERGLLGRLLEAIDRYVRLRYRVEDFEQVVKGELNLNEGEQQHTRDLYRTFLKLEKEGKNHVWTSIIKNAFAPLTILSSIGKFDYVVGNPPWINWENLPEEYRDASKALWFQYNLIHKTKGGGLGKVKKDLSMLFLTVSVNRYVEDYGTLGLLLPFTLFKGKAGAGFRRFLANHCKVKMIHDLIELYPFEGATNRTSMIILKKGETSFPITCVMWSNPKSVGISQEADLRTVFMSTKQFDMILVPLKRKKPELPWMIISHGAYDVIEKIMKSSEYKAHAGVYTGLDGVYWVSKHSLHPKGILVSNIAKTAKKTVKRITKVVEQELVYPLVRGRNHKKWHCQPKRYIVLPTDPRGAVLKTSKMKVRYPNCYSYFNEFFSDLTNRKGQPYKTMLKPYKKQEREVAEAIAPPFYTIINAKHALTPYKVVWKHISGKISGKAKFETAVISKFKEDQDIVSTSVIPSHGIMFISCQTESEAHYICAVLNSSIASLIVSSYALEVHVTTDIPNYVFIPKFDSTNVIHRRFSDLSREAHKLAVREDGEGLKRVEEDIDRLAAQLYGLTEENLKEIKKCLAILKGEEVEEETVEEEPKEVKIDFLDAVVRPNAIGSFEVAVSNPFKEKITIELQLPERRVKLETDKEEDKIRVKVPPLETGEYKVPYKIITPEGVVEGDFMLYVKEEVRHRAREALASKLDELMSA